MTPESVCCMTDRIFSVYVPLLFPFILPHLSPSLCLSRVMLWNIFVLFLVRFLWPRSLSAEASEWFRLWRSVFGAYLFHKQSLTGPYVGASRAQTKLVKSLRVRPSVEFPFALGPSSIRKSLVPSFWTSLILHAHNLARNFWTDLGISSHLTRSRTSTSSAATSRMDVQQCRSCYLCCIASLSLDNFHQLTTQVITLCWI